MSRSGVSRIVKDSFACGSLARSLLLSVTLCLPAVASELVNVSHVVQSIGGPYNAIADVQSEVQSLLDELATNNAIPVNNIRVFIANNPGRNALASGNLTSGTVVINRGLLALVADRQQLRAALAHELAHLQRQDSGGHRRLIVERRADTLAVKWLGEAAGLRALLALLSTTTELDSAQQHFAARQQYLPNGGYTPEALPPGIQRLQAHEALYSRYQQAQAQLSRGDNISAEAVKLTKALPGEAKFWLLLGNSLSSTPPCDFYAAAVDKNPDWFLPWLKLGECQQQQGGEATEPLRNSLALLPTPHARTLLNKSQPES